jgi:hypothetical protein
MNSKKFGDILGTIIFVAVALLCLLTLVVEKTHPYKPNLITLHNPYLCVETHNGWQQVENFATDEAYYICGQISSAKPDLDAQIEIFVYENKYTSQRNAVFFDVVRIQNGEVTIHIDTYLYPGKYVVQISDGRTTLAFVNLLVTEK